MCRSIAEGGRRCTGAHSGAGRLAPTPAPRHTPAAPRTVAAQLDDVYADLADVPGDWVSITAMRARLTGVSREEVDAELLRRLDAEEIVLAPEADQQRLTPSDRAAAIVVGGRPCHLLTVHGDDWA